jgi:probable O-glycosylation ligase (exosortase A-associated)
VRDFIVLAIILGAAPISLFRPYVGLLMWTWIAYFNPHRFTWGIAYNFPVALVIAVPTLLGTLFARKLNRHFFVTETILLLSLWVWFVVTWFTASHMPVFADHIIEATDELIFVSKILLMTILSMLLVSSAKKLKYLFLVTALSFGVLTVKGAAFGLLTGGQFRVWGPPGSFVEDNNAFALAVNMAIPMFFFMAREEENWKLRLLLRSLFVAGILSVILTYSRGGLLGLTVVLAAIAFKSHHKFLSIFLATVCAFMVLTFAPPQWTARMKSFAGGELDESARQRLVSWGFAWNLAKDYPITGGGFRTFTPALFTRYAPEPLPGGQSSSGPHSIYFQVLAEHGFVGLSLFALLLGACWHSLRKLRKRGRLLPSGSWMVSYSHMMESSLLGFMVSGAFLEFAYFDLYFQLVAVTVIMKALCHGETLNYVTRVSEANLITGELKEAVTL